MTALEDLRHSISALLAGVGVSQASVLVLTPHGPTKRTLLSFGCEGERAAFRLFSVTKLFTAAAVLRLVHRNVLSLESDVGALLTASAQSGEDWASLQGVTVAQLLSHTSGLTDTSLATIFATHDPSQPAPSTAEVLSRFKLHRRPLADNEQPSAAYANVNYLVLGLLIERLAEMPFCEALRTLVLGPLGSGADFTVLNPEHAAVGTIGPFSAFLFGVLLGCNTISSLLRPGPPPPEVMPVRCGTRALRHVDLDGAPYGGLVGTAPDIAPLVEAALETAWHETVVAGKAPPTITATTENNSSLHILFDAALASAKKCAGLTQRAAARTTAPKQDIRSIASLAFPSVKKPGPRAIQGGGDALNFQMVPEIALQIAAREPVGIVSREGACLGWKAGFCPARDGPLPLPAAHYRNHEGAGGGFTSELRIYLPAGPSMHTPRGMASTADPLGVVVLMNKHSVDMHEVRVAHQICEMVRAAVFAGAFAAKE